MMKIAMCAAALMIGTVTAVALSKSPAATGAPTAAAQVDTMGLTTSSPALPTLSADMF
jgi:hypothetical protein